MAAATILTKFSAVDQMTSVIKKINGETTKMGRGVNTAISKIERTGQKINKTFDGILGTLGKVGIGLGALSIISGIATANIEVEDSLASLQAITGVTGTAFESFENKIVEVSRAQTVFAADTAKAFEIVGSAKPELLSNAAALGDVTDAVLTLSKAGRMEVPKAAKAVTSALNQFGLGAEHSQRAINTLAAGAKEGASGIQPSIEALSKFGTIAANLGVTLEESIGAIETLAPFEQGAEAGTKLRNVLAKLASAEILSGDAADYLAKYGVDTAIVTDKTRTLTERMREMSKIQNDSNAIMKVFGTETSAAATAMLQNVYVLEDMTKAVTGTNEATEQANQNSNTLKALIEDVNNAYKNATVSVDRHNWAMEFLKNVLKFVIKNMDSIISYAGLFVVAFGAMKAIIIAYKSAVVAITTVTKLWTLAQMWLNIQMALNPVGLIVAAIVAAIAVVSLAIYKWDEWGAALAVFMGPLGMVISLIMSLRKHWDSVVDAFKSDGIIGGIKAIGRVILDAILMPIQSLLELLAYIPGLDIASTGADEIQKFRDGLFPGVPDAIPNTTTSTISTVSRSEENKTQTIGFNWNNIPTGLDITSEGDEIVPIPFAPTTGGF